MKGEKQVSVKGRGVFIGIPCHDGKIDVRIAGAVLEAKHNLTTFGCSVGMGWMTYCSSISRARNAIAAKFLSLDPVWSDLLMIDSDTVPRGQDIVQAVARGSDYDVVAGAVPVQSEIKNQIRFKFDFAGGADEPTFDDEGMAEVDRIGTAFMNVRRHVMEKLAKDAPTYWVNDTQERHPVLFNETFNGDSILGEDYYFCDLVKKYGFKIHIDPTMQFAHVKAQDLIGAYGQQMQHMRVEKSGEAKLK